MYYGGPPTIVQYSKTNRKQQRGHDVSKNFVKARKASMEDIAGTRDGQRVFSPVRQSFKESSQGS